MPTFEVDIDDGLAQTLRAILPPGWTVEDWLGLKAEEAIAQARLDDRRRRIRSDAADGPQNAPGPVPTDALRSNDDAQRPPAGSADADADD